MFGLYATTGKAAAPLAPALFTLFTVLYSYWRSRWFLIGVKSGGRSRSPNMFRRIRRCQELNQRGRGNVRNIDGGNRWLIVR